MWLENWTWRISMYSHYFNFFLQLYVYFLVVIVKRYTNILDRNSVRGAQLLILTEMCLILCVVHMTVLIFYLAGISTVPRHHQWKFRGYFVYNFWVSRICDKSISILMKKKNLWGEKVYCTLCTVDLLDIITVLTFLRYQVRPLNIFWN